VLVDHAEQPRADRDRTGGDSRSSPSPLGSVRRGSRWTATWSLWARRHAGDRAFPSERARAQPDVGSDAGWRRALRHGDPQSATTRNVITLSSSIVERALGRRCSRTGARDVRVDRRRPEVSAEDSVTRDAKRYQVRGGQTIGIAQWRSWARPCWSAGRSCRGDGARAERKELALYALMVTDVLAHGTEMLVAGDVAAVARAWRRADDAHIELPGVMTAERSGAEGDDRALTDAARAPTESDGASRQAVRAGIGPGIGREDVHRRRRGSRSGSSGLGQTFYRD